MILPPVSSDTIAARGSRLLHHGEVYYLKGDSYRLRGKPKPDVFRRIERRAGDGHSGSEVYSGENAGQLAGSGA